MKYIQLFIVFILTVFMTGCATILTGTTQRITIDSMPQGADIIIDGRMMGTTPAKVRLDKDINAFIDGGKDIYLELDGYENSPYYLGTDIEAMSILNFFCPPGLVIDALTGAMMRYDSEYYNFRLIQMNGNSYYNGYQQNSYSTTPPNQSQSNGEAEEEDDYEKLMKLVDLYEEGLITEEEFEAGKADIYNKKRE